MGSHGLATRAMDSFWLLAFSDCKGRDADERGAEFQRRNEAMVSYLQTLPQITDGIGHRLPRFDGGIFGISQCTASVRLAMLQHLEILLDVSVSLDGIPGCTRPGGDGDSQPLSNFESEAAFEAGWKVVRHTSALARELYDTETDLTNDTLKSIDAAVRGYWIVARHAFTHVNSAIRTANSKKQKITRSLYKSSETLPAATRCPQQSRNISKNTSWRTYRRYSRRCLLSTPFSDTGYCMASARRLQKKYT